MNKTKFHKPFCAKLLLKDKSSELELYYIGNRKKFELDKKVIIDTQKCQYTDLKVGDMDISGRIPPRRIPQHLCLGGVHFL